MNHLALHLCLALGLILSNFFQSAHAQDMELPRPSPKAMVMQRMGIADIEVAYSSPGVKGREIWGGLVPYDELWRTGANAATKLSVSRAIMVEGEQLPAGHYALFTIPGQNTWTLVINEEWEQWGTGSYEEEKDVLRVEVEPQKTERMQERLIFKFDLQDNQTGDLVLAWEHLRLPIDIEVPVIDQAMASIEGTLEQYNRKWMALRDAADFCLDYDVKHEQAMAWVEQSIEMEKDFSNMWVKARLLARQEDYPKAIKVAQKAQPMLSEKSEGYREFYEAQLLSSINKWEGLR